MSGIDVVIHHPCRIKEGRSVLWLIHVLQHGLASALAVARPSAQVAAGQLAPEEAADAAYPVAWVRACKMCVAAPAGQTLGCAAHVAWPLTGALEQAVWVTARRALAQELPPAYGDEAARFARAALRRRETPWVDAARRSGLLQQPQPRGVAVRWPWQPRPTAPSSGQLLEHLLTADHLQGEGLRQCAGFVQALVAVGERLADSARSLEQLEALAHALEPWRRVRDLLGLAAREGLEVRLHAGRTLG